MKKLIVTLILLLLFSVTAHADTVWNSADKHADVTLSNGDLTTVVASSSWRGVRATPVLASDAKIYFEVVVTDTSYFMLGVGTSASPLDAIPGVADSTSWTWGWTGAANAYLAGNSGGSFSGAYPVPGDIVGVCIDVDEGKMWFAINNVYVLSGNPAAGTDPTWSGLTGTLYIIWAGRINTGNTLATTDGDATYTAPSGFQLIDGIVTTPATNLLDGKVDIFYTESLAGMGNNLNWHEEFDVDLSNWTDLTEVGASVSLDDSLIVSTSMNDALVLEATVGEYASVERAFAFGTSENWYLEFDIQYGEDGEGTVELLNSGNDVLATIELGSTADQLDFYTDLSGTPATAVFTDAGDAKGRRIILGYDYSTESITCSLTDSGGATLGVPMSVVDTKAITPANNLKIRFTAVDGSADNILWVDNCIVAESQMLAIGGSVTQGFQVWSNILFDYEKRLGRDQPWVNVLSSKYEKNHILSFAFGGSSFQRELDHTVIDHMLLYNPTKFLMIYGHNDFILDGKTQSEVRTLFDNALTKIQNFGITGADIMIGNCQTSSYFTTAPLQTLRDDYNAWLQTRQQEEGFILLDIYTITVDPGDPQSINPLYDDGDGVHFNALGMEAIAAGAYHHIESPVNLLDGKVVITDGSDTPIGLWNEW